MLISRASFIRLQRASSSHAALLLGLQQRAPRAMQPIHPHRHCRPQQNTVSRAPSHTAHFLVSAPSLHAAMDRCSQPACTSDDVVPRNPYAQCLSGRGAPSFRIAIMCPGVVFVMQKGRYKHVVRDVWMNQRSRFWISLEGIVVAEDLACSWPWRAT